MECEIGQLAARCPGNPFLPVLRRAFLKVWDLLNITDIDRCDGKHQHEPAGWWRQLPTADYAAYKYPLPEQHATSAPELP